MPARRRAGTSWCSRATTRRVFWDTTLPAVRRDSFRWQQLLSAPVIALPFADAKAYTDRYAEPDKIQTGLGAGTDAWPVPYWTIDASMSVMTLLLAAEDVGLGALFFGVFRGERELRQVLGVPPGPRTARCGGDRPSRRPIRRRDGSRSQRRSPASPARRDHPSRSLVGASARVVGVDRGQPDRSAGERLAESLDACPVASGRRSRDRRRRSRRRARPTAASRTAHPRPAPCRAARSNGRGAPCRVGRRRSPPR